MSSKKKADKTEESSARPGWNKQNAMIQIAIVLVAFIGAAIYWYLTK